MKNQPLKLLVIAALVAVGLSAVACSSSGNNPGGGLGGGAQAGATGATGTGGSTVHMVYPAYPGSCSDGMDNPDYQGTGACSPGCQSVSCGTACTQDCCVTCGIDGLGIKFCQCRTPGLPYANCNCAAPASIPLGLMGGPCVPAGDSRAMPPAGSQMAIRGMPCKMLNLVCFTADSVSSSERGCICQDDGGGVLTLHCGSVNKWFSNTGTPTNWMP